MDDIIVFPGGLEALGQQGALNPHFVQAAGFSGPSVPPKAQTGYEVLGNLASVGALPLYKGKVTYRRNAEDRADIPAHSRKNGELEKKWEDLQARCPEQAKESVYLAEVRCLQSQ